MTQPVLCIYHADCADDLLAAWAVKRVLPDAEFVAARYGDDPPECFWVEALDPDRGKVRGLYTANLKDRDILIVDFSYPLPVLRAMAAEARSVLVLDHHKTAAEDLGSIDRPHGQVFADWLNYDQLRPGANLAAIFDMERSGCGITWDYLHPNNELLARRSDATSETSVGRPTSDRSGVVSTRGSVSGGHCGEQRTAPAPRPAARVAPSDGVSGRPRIIDLVEDRDLWQFKFADSKAFHAVLVSYDWHDLPGMFDLLDSWYHLEQTFSGTPHYEREWAALLNEGSAILRARQRAVEAIVRATRRTMRIAGCIVPCANVPHEMASDVGELLCQAFGPENTSPEAVHIFINSEYRYQPMFSATYYDGADGRRYFSLCSPEGGADVGEIARRVVERLNSSRTGSEITKAFIGSGHEHAAGFDAPLGWEGE
jgi:uncharacterized protein